MHIESIVKKVQQRLYFLRQQRKLNLPQDLLKWFYSTMIESILCTSIPVMVQLSYQIWPQKTTEGSPDCWVPLSPPPKQSPRIVLLQSEQRGWQNHCGPLTSSWYCLVDATELWAPERPDTETVSSLRQSISWTLDNKVEHTFLYIYLFNTHTYLHFKFAHHTCTYINVYFVYGCFFYTILYIVYFLYLYIILCIICVLSCYCHCCSVELLSLKKFFVCANVPAINLFLKTLNQLN